MKGVYFLTSIINDVEVVTYVGQSTEVKDRIGNHLFNKNFNYVYYLSLDQIINIYMDHTKKKLKEFEKAENWNGLNWSHKEILKEAESYYIQRLCPSENKKMEIESFNQFFNINRDVLKQGTIDIGLGIHKVIYTNKDFDNLFKDKIKLLELNYFDNFQGE